MPRVKRITIENPVINSPFEKPRRHFPVSEEGITHGFLEKTRDMKGETARRLELHIDHIDPEASQEDILFELLLKAGFMPTEKAEKREMAGRAVFAVAGGSLLICLESEITRELIDAVAEAGPRRFICLDRGFRGNDQLKANAVQTFAARNQGRDKTEQILFRTV